MNTKTLAQLLIECDYVDDKTPEAAIALAFFVAGAAASMLMARCGTAPEEIFDQIDTLSAIAQRNVVALMAIKS